MNDDFMEEACDKFVFRVMKGLFYHVDSPLLVIEVFKDHRCRVGEERDRHRAGYYQVGQRGKYSMGERGKILWWVLAMLGIVVAAGVLGMGRNERQLQAPASPEPSTNTDEELKKALSSGKPVLVDFGSNRCIPCRQIRPILNEISQEFSGKAYVLIIDVYKYQALVREYRIQLIPTLIFFNSSGKEVFRRSGAWDKNSIVQKLGKAGMN